MATIEEKVYECSQQAAKLFLEQVNTYGTEAAIKGFSIAIGLAAGGQEHPELALQEAFSLMQVFAKKDL